MKHMSYEHHVLWTTWDMNLMYYEPHEIWTPCTMKLIQDINVMYYETHEIWTSCTMKHMRYEPHVLWTTRRMWFIVHFWRMSYVYTALRSVTPIIVWCSIFNLHDPLMMKQYRSFWFSTGYCFLILLSIHRWGFIVDIVFIPASDMASCLDSSPRP